MVGEHHGKFPADVDFLLVNLGGMHALGVKREGNLRVLGARRQSGMLGASWAYFEWLT
jgi:hypothetical protein